MNEDRDPFEEPYEPERGLGVLIAGALWAIAIFIVAAAYFAWRNGK